VTSVTSDEAVRQGHAQETRGVFWGPGEGRLLGMGSGSISWTVCYASGAPVGRYRRQLGGTFLGQPRTSLGCGLIPLKSFFVFVNSLYSLYVKIRV